jgi:hypothetical protein
MTSDLTGVVCRLVDTSMIHDTLAVIANEVKQSSGLLFWIAASATLLPRCARS